jgi:hypothetical protein
MPVLEGVHTRLGGQQRVGYRVEYDVVGNAIHFRAIFSGAEAPAAHEGQFDFEPSRVAAAMAVDAFIQNHIAKGHFNLAP